MCIDLFGVDLDALLDVCGLDTDLAYHVMAHASGGEFVCDMDEMFSPDFWATGHGSLSGTENAFRASEAKDRILGAQENPANRTPASFREAMSIDELCKEKLWANPCQNEVNKMFEYGVWRIPETPVPTDAKIPVCIWDFTIKRNADGSINKRRARCCLDGSRLTKGIHYEKTFSPVAAQRSIRYLWHIAVAHHTIPGCFDVEVAFLNATMDRIMYVYPPDGFKVYDADGKLQAYLVEKAMYGAPQAPRCWYHEFDAIVKIHKFIRCLVDPCVWFYRNLKWFYIIAIHVDDIFRVTNMDIKKADKWFQDIVCKALKLTNLGPAYIHCGIQAQIFPCGSVLLHQGRYATDVVKRFGFTKCKAAKVPINPDVKFVKGDPDDVFLSEEDASIFKQKIGSLAFGSANCWVTLQ